MMWSGFEGMGWGWIGLGMVHMLLFWVLVILGIAVLVRWLAGGSSGARGEIPPHRYLSPEVLLIGDDRNA